VHLVSFPVYIEHIVRHFVTFAPLNFTSCGLIIDVAKD